MNNKDERTYKNAVLYEPLEPVKPKVSRRAILEHLKYPAFEGPVFEPEPQSHSPMMVGYVPPGREGSSDVCVVKALHKTISNKTVFNQGEPSPPSEPRGSIRR